MGGQVVLPGLTDAHIHLENYALGLQKVDCETATRQECLQRVAERVRLTPPGEWILGHGWNQNNWQEGFGTAGDAGRHRAPQPGLFDSQIAACRLGQPRSAAPGQPERWDARPAWRAPGTRRAWQPDGILFESAMALVSGAIPEASPEAVAQAIDGAQAVLWGMGLTGAHDFDRRRCFMALQTLHRRGDLRLRVVKSIPIDDLPHAVALGLRTGFGDDTLRIGAVKVFADGALGPRTAAMLQPYVGEPDNQGMLLLDAEELYERGRLAVENGLSLAVHAIGDRANHEVLDAFAQLKKLDAGKDLRHRIEHVQLIHPGRCAAAWQSWVLSPPCSRSTPPRICRWPIASGASERRSHMPGAPS